MAPVIHSPLDACLTLLALWGLVGLAALTEGIVAYQPRVRLAGFALFGLTLAKIFFYDLSALTALQRAFSFLAVGAVLLIAGFFYQHLTGGSGRTGGPPPTPART